MKFFGLFASVFLLPMWSFADDCNYSKVYDFAVDSGTLERLLLDVGAGSLVVTGDVSSDEIRVVATACANSNNRLDSLELNHRVAGSELIVDTRKNRNRSFFWWLNFGNSYAYIDIEVRMPSDLQLEVEDGSGGVDISGVSTLRLQDGSGAIRIENIAGDVAVDDGSGSIAITSVTGRVSIRDGSGPISIRDSYDVVIDDDGSGDIQIENIQSNVTVLDDGSGSIRILDVGGNVEIFDAGSGSVNVRGVAGTYNNHDD